MTRLRLRQSWKHDLLPFYTRLKMHTVQKYDKYKSKGIPDKIIIDNLEMFHYVLICISKKQTGVAFTLPLLLFVISVQPCDFSIKV